MYIELYLWTPVGVDIVYSPGCPDTDLFSVLVWNSRMWYRFHYYALYLLPSIANTDVLDGVELLVLIPGEIILHNNQ